MVSLYKLTTISPGSSLKSKANLKISLRQHPRMRQQTTNVATNPILYISTFLLHRGVEFSKNEMPTAELLSYLYKHKFGFKQVVLSSSSSQKTPENHSFSLTLRKYILVSPSLSRFIRTNLLL